LSYLPKKLKRLGPANEPQVVLNENVRKVWFAADRSTATVRVRWSSRGGGGGNNPNERYIGWYLPDNDFEDVRPCVMLSGVSSAIVKSAPADWPAAAFEEIVILVVVR
jgi:hypothetical protein